MARLLPLLLGLALPGCRGDGAQGIPVPAPMDMASIARPASPNTALAAPTAFRPEPDIVVPPFKVAPARLYAAIRAVAESRPRVFLHVAYDDRMQVHYVARSALLNFPDLVTVQVNPDASLVLWSRSVYGQSDLGVNRRRLADWLAVLDRRLAAG
jgi:uncharacterized protein (DUF1499 family)